MSREANAVRPASETGEGHEMSSDEIEETTPLPNKRSAADLPLYLCPRFTMRFQFFVLVQWFGINLRQNHVFLRIVYPQLTSQVFTSFKDCVAFLIDPSQKLPIDLHDCWFAFSYETILPILQSYFQTLNTTLLMNMAQKMKYPLKELFDVLEVMQPPPFYCFKMSAKYRAVAKIETFLQSVKGGGAQSMQDDVKVAAQTSATQSTPPPSNNPLTWADDEWNNEHMVMAYFNNLRYRLQTKCQFDPPLRGIKGWKPEKNGGMDMMFLCHFDDGRAEGRNFWVHYLQLQMNAAYKVIMDNFIETTPKITQHIQATTL